MNDLLIKFGLRFESPEQETSFVRSFALGELRRAQAAMVLGAIVYCAFAIWDRILDPLAWTTTFAIRAAVAAIILLPLTAALFLPRARRWAEPIYLLYCVVPGCVLSIIYLFIDRGFEHSTAGMIIVILFVSTLLPLRLPALTVFCITTWACFIYCQTFATYLTDGLRFINNFEIGFAYVLSLYAVGAREFQARRQFQTSQALQDEKERSVAALVELQSTQWQLVQAEKLASLGQLVAGVSHEVSTPLGVALTTATVLEGELKMLTATIESSQVRRSALTQSIARLSEGMKLLFDNHRRAADLVHSFKQVATDEANQERRAFEIRGWLGEVMSTLQPLLDRSGHTVRVICEDGIVADTYPGALAQVIRNLALNAAVHGFPDGRTGVIELAVSRLDDCNMRVVVADNGAGIPPDDLPKVFDPFFTTRRDKGSTGLGLHIVFNLVVSTLKGQIDLASEPWQGTRFTLDLPLDPENPSSPASKTGEFQVSHGATGPEARHRALS
ncbi:HAMP domain-containing sensor histidine kinase [Tardiphaga sp. 709]|uniref:sensor histidine kinase n=1 Tax=Tardiphaga sp. 709 TaxID=3076039 RepID=UPI0028E718C6|nr:HAMP domain-containing sensor histidine kinase [Tardiphaga sp. 709]WNV08348.1 HAMP domain-containing sensor histidine kinase [Tardiphaga sp. 709]